MASSFSQQEPSVLSGKGGERESHLRRFLEAARHLSAEKQKIGTGLAGMAGLTSEEMLSQTRRAKNWKQRYQDLQDLVERYREARASRTPLRINRRRAPLLSEINMIAQSMLRFIRMLRHAKNEVEAANWEIRLKDLEMASRFFGNEGLADLGKTENYICPTESEPRR